MALRNFNNNKNIVTLAVDKDNAYVVLDVSGYTQKKRNLQDPPACKKLSRDPTSKILRKTNVLITDSTIPLIDQRAIKRSEVLPPTLYRLPKIHKPYATCPCHLS